MTQDVRCHTFAKGAGRSRHREVLDQQEVHGVAVHVRPYDAPSGETQELIADLSRVASGLTLPDWRSPWTRRQACP
jgi:hypothetical protein